MQFAGIVEPSRNLGQSTGPFRGETEHICCCECDWGPCVKFVVLVARAKCDEGFAGFVLHAGKLELTKPFSRRWMGELAFCYVPHGAISYEATP